MLPLSSIQLGKKYAYMPVDSDQHIMMVVVTEVVHNATFENCFVSLTRERNYAGPTIQHGAEVCVWQEHADVNGYIMRLFEII